MATFRVGEATVGYAVEGEGVPLLLFHGTTMARAAWDMVRAAMPPNTYKFVLFEFPGSGESSMPHEPITVEGVVDQALALMTHLGIESFHVGGYSLGAVIALAAAATAPQRVRSVTSVCGWAVSDARMRITFELWTRLIGADPELFMRYAIADGYTAGALSMLEPMVDALVPMGAGTVAAGSGAQLDLDKVLDITSMLSSIAAPTLIIGGIEDRWVDITHSRSLSQKVAGSRLVELPAGHLVVQELSVDVATLLHDHIASS